MEVDDTKASSSIGRAAVSKTAGWGFDSLLACHLAPSPRSRSGRGGAGTSQDDTSVGPDTRPASRTGAPPEASGEPGRKAVTSTRRCRRPQVENMSSRTESSRSDARTRLKWAASAFVILVIAAIGCLLLLVRRVADPGPHHHPARRRRPRGAGFVALQTEPGRVGVGVRARGAHRGAQGGMAHPASETLQTTGLIVIAMVADWWPIILWILDGLHPRRHHALGDELPARRDGWA